MATLNKSGRTHARTLIDAGSVDKDTAWSFSAADGDALLGDGGNDWANYGRFHLGTDGGEAFDTKDHWKYPFGKDGKVYRSALVAIRQRASAQRDNAIYDAAGSLLDEIDGTTDRTHQNSVDVSADVVVVNARPPRIEIHPRMDVSVESPPIDEETLARWTPGLRAENSDATGVIRILDVIGYDFWTGGSITAESVAKELDQIGSNPVEVHINSPGGDMFEGIAIYNVLREHPAPITVKVLALAASAASVIGMAGNEILVSPSSFIMIHNAWVMAMGNRHDFMEVANYLEPFDMALRDIYVAKTGQKADQVTTWMDADTYMNGNTAIERKFATGLLGADKVTEDKAKTSRAKALNAVRVIESNLCRRGGMSRGKARALINQMHADKLAAAGIQIDTTHDAGVNVTPGADATTIAGLRSLLETIQG